MLRKTTLAARLREERLRLGLSAREMAAIGGISPASQSLYEADKRVPDARYLSAALADGLDVHYLLTGERASELVARRFNWSIHDEIFIEIERWLAEQQLSLPAAKKMQILKILFEHLREGEAVDRCKIADLLRLAA